MAARIRFNGRWAGGCKATGQVFAADGEPFNEAADNPVPEAFSVGGSRGMCPVNREHSGPQVRPFPAECSTFFSFSARRIYLLPTDIFMFKWSSPARNVSYVRVLFALCSPVIAAHFVCRLDCRHGPSAQVSAGSGNTCHLLRPKF